LPGLSICGLDRPTWPKVRPDVVREERQDLVRHLPLRLGESLLDEAVDRDPNQLEAGAQREVELVEHGLPLLQQMGDIGHELVDDTVDLMGDGPRPLLRICDRYRSTTFWCSLLGSLELHQSLNVRAAQRRDFLPDLADLVQPARADGLAPVTAGLGVANDAGAVPSIV